MKRRHFIGAAAATGIAIHGRADAQSTVNLRIAHVLSPTPSPLIAYPRAWTPGTNGPVTADAVLAVRAVRADLAVEQLADDRVAVQPARVVGDDDHAAPPVAGHHLAELLRP